MEDSDGSSNSDGDGLLGPDKKPKRDRPGADDDSTPLTKRRKKELKKRRKEKKLLEKLEKERKLPQTKGDLEHDKVEQVGRAYTVSIAVAGSIISNAQSPALQAYLTGQIARAAAIYNVDEIVVFDDLGGSGNNDCEQMARLLQFLECPQYLRKCLFPLHPDLKFAGVVSPLDIPHHLRKNEALMYREGVVTDKPLKIGEDYCYVNVGLDIDCKVDRKLDPGTRVTVKFHCDKPTDILKQKGKLKGSVVSPQLPRKESGIYWGYSVRIATSLIKVFKESMYSGGYDCTVGTSERGINVEEMILSKNVKHFLIVFGGVEGLEYALENDESSKETEVSKLFHHYVNTCPHQGCRTIRTEEALLLSLTALNSKIPFSPSRLKTAELTS